MNYKNEYNYDYMERKCLGQQDLCKKFNRKYKYPDKNSTKILEYKSIKKS